jgi:hypothetical protein
MSVPIDSLLLESATASPPADELQFDSSAPFRTEETLHRLPREAKKACLKQAAQRLSPALLHVVHQSTAKSRDRALAALVILIYGPTPFGGANTIKDVAIRYGMTEQHLHQLVGTLRGLLQPALPVEDHE